MTSAASRWIVSPAVDLTMVAVPFALAAGLAFVPHDPEAALPLWAFLFLVVAFDVAHVWSTLYISYLDREVFSRRRLLLLSVQAVDSNRLFGVL